MTTGKTTATTNMKTDYNDTPIMTAAADLRTEYSNCPDQSFCAETTIMDRSEVYEDVMKENKDLLEALDSEVLFDYLVQNGVLNMNTVHDIKNANEGPEVNKALIRHLATEGQTNHMGLFINALRQTGHLQLANLLETGPRIQPRRWNSLGYLNRSRHKGQICFILQVNAIEISPEQFPKRKGLSGISYWIWLEDLHPKDNDSINLQTSISQPHLNEKIENVEIEEKQPKLWCCGCFSSGSKKRKNKYKENKNIQLQPLRPIVEEPEKLPIGSPEPMDASDSGLENSENEAENCDELKWKAEILHKKSTKFYHLLTGQESRIRNKLLQYFEQNRGILILDTINEDGIIIVCISTKIQQLVALQADFLNGQLVEDLEQTLLDEELKKSMMVKNMKLQLSVDEEEFPKAIGDLEGC